MCCVLSVVVRGQVEQLLARRGGPKPVPGVFCIVFYIIFVKSVVSELVVFYKTIHVLQYL